MTETKEAGLVLVSKVVDALKQMGYKEQDAKKVKSLVESNASTAVFTTDALDHSGRVDEILQQIHGHLIRVNSNEPVLLINESGGRPRVEDLTNNFLQELRNKWNIWPVRIYAGYFTEGASSITVLNVVNTELGGPSMIQLLDYPTEEIAWNACALKEVWNNGSFVSRKVRYPQAEQMVDNQAMDVDEEPSHDTDPVVLRTEAAETVDEVPEKKPVDDASGLASPEESDREDAEIVEAWERPDIIHPTWSHEDEHESLYDLVRRYSGRLATPESISDEADKPKQRTSQLAELEMGQSEVDAGPGATDKAAEGSDEEAFELVSA